MKHHSVLMVSVAFFTLSAGQAFAGCADEIASLSPNPEVTGAIGGEGAGSTGKISKDGSLAPLGSAAEASRPGGGPGIAKDGSTMPLANKPGGGDTDMAMSRQDAQSQQRSGETAAAAGGSSTGQGPAASQSRPQPRVAALERARTLLQQGDERGCMEAVEEAKRLE
jgi:hypothetical protein